MKWHKYVVDISCVHDLPPPISILSLQILCVSSKLPWLSGLFFAPRTSTESIDMKQIYWSWIPHRLLIHLVSLSCENGKLSIKLKEILLNKNLHLGLSRIWTKIDIFLALALHSLLILLSETEERVLGQMQLMFVNPRRQQAQKKALINNLAQLGWKLAILSLKTIFIPIAEWGRHPQKWTHRWGCLPD